MEAFLNESEFWDWRKSNLPALDEVEASLKCQICHDFLRAPVSINSCDHTFCSECLRSALKIESKSPCCRKICDTCNFKPNRSLKLTVSAYLRARSQLLVAAGVEVKCLINSGNDEEKKEDELEQNNQQERREQKNVPGLPYHLTKTPKLRQIVNRLKFKVENKTRDELIELHKLYRTKFNARLDQGTSISPAQATVLRKEVTKELNLKTKSQKHKSSVIICGEKATLELKAAAKVQFHQLVQQARKAKMKDKKNKKNEKANEKKADKISVVVEKITASGAVSSSSSSSSYSSPITAKPTTTRIVAKRITNIDCGDFKLDDSGVHLIDLQVHCKGPEWRKTYVPELNMVVYFNELTSETLAGPPEPVSALEPNIIEIDETIASTKNGKWQCSVCTLINPEDAIKCHVCGHQLDNLDLKKNSSVKRKSACDPSQRNPFTTAAAAAGKTKRRRG